MKIQPITCNYQSTNFKSTFPVVHWVGEANGSYAYMSEKALVEDFQRRLIDMLQMSLKTVADKIKELDKKLLKKNISEEEKKDILKKRKRLYEILDIPAQRLRGYLGIADVDYRNIHKVRSYYNTVHGGINAPTSVAYLISGNAVKDFNKQFANELGKRRAENKKLIEKGALKNGEKTPDLIGAINKYRYGGYNYVNAYPRRIKDESGATQVLHTKFEIERDSDGQFMDYRFVDARFLPEFGPNSPFEKLKR